MEEGRSAFKILSANPTVNRPVGRPRRRWGNNVRMDLKEIDVSVKIWIDSAQDKDYCRDLMNSELSFLVLNIMELVSL